MDKGSNNNVKELNLLKKFWFSLNSMSINLYLHMIYNYYDIKCYRYMGSHVVLRVVSIC